MSNAVEKSTGLSTTEALLAVCKPIFKAHGLVSGKTSSKYGDFYQFKTEAFGEDAVSREVAKQITEQIEAEARKICQGKLQLSKINTKYGDGYQITIKADGINIGRNGINLSAQFAQDFAMTAWAYGLTQDALGAETVSNGRKMYLAGVQITRNGDFKAWVLQDEQGKQYINMNESHITRFGGKPIQRLTVKA